MNIANNEVRTLKRHVSDLNALQRDPDIAKANLCHKLREQQLAYDRMFTSTKQCLQTKKKNLHLIKIIKDLVLKHTETAELLAVKSAELTVNETCFCVYAYTLKVGGSSLR